MAAHIGSEAELLLRAYIIENGDINKAALELARDLIEALDTLAALRVEIEKLHSHVSKGFLRRNR